MLKSLCVLFSVLLVAPLASAEIFKYVGKHGEDLYQNFPCQFESMGRMPEDALTDRMPAATAPLIAAKKSPPRPQSRVSA